MTALTASFIPAAGLLGGSRWPMNYMTGHGPVASALARLGWLLTIISLVVVVITGVLLLVACVRARRASERRRDGDGRRALRWIYVGGLIIPSIILIGSFAFTLASLDAVAQPARNPAASIRVVGHRWWWEVDYLERGVPVVVTANEIHIPVGEPVELELVSADIAHSFWIPPLAGKTDMLPGMRNVSWLQADSAGVYRGQCTEYCGTQHANMAAIVIAEPPAQYAAWLAAQRLPATEPTDSAAVAGKELFARNCAYCHAIRGGDARGTLGPDLTHVMSRRTLAAGTLVNSRGDLAGWIGNAQALKPGNLMPAMRLSSSELRELLAYVETLR